LLKSPFTFYQLKTQQYGPANNGSRPGGEQVTYAILINSNPSAAQDASTSATTSNSSSLPTFYLIGDVQSASYVVSALQTNCSIVGATNVSDGTVHTSQVIQYYRASSFALALSSYNYTPPSQSYDPLVNTSLSSSSSYYNISTPAIASLAMTGVNMTLLACVNSTIGAALPLLDGENGGSGLSVTSILWIVVFSIQLASIVFAGVARCCYS